MRVILTLTLLGTAAALSACEPVTATTIGMNVARSGAAFYSSGKIYAVRIADFDDVVGAVRDTAAALAMSFEEEDVDDDRAMLKYEDDDGATILIVINRKTEVLTAFRVDVGAFGSEPLARLFLAQVEERLEAIDAEHGDAPEGDGEAFRPRSSDF